MRLQKFAGYALNTLYDTNNKVDFSKSASCKSYIVLKFQVYSFDFILIVSGMGPVPVILPFEF